MDKISNRDWSINTNNKVGCFWSYKKCDIKTALCVQSFCKNTDKMNAISLLPKEIQTLFLPQEWVYYREINISSVFVNDYPTGEEESRNIALSNELDVIVTPFVRKHIEEIAKKTSVRNKEALLLANSKAKSVRDFPNFEYYNNRAITNIQKGRNTFYIDREFIKDIICNHLDKIPLDLVFSKDIQKKWSDYIAKTKRFFANQDTTGAYSQFISSWHQSKQFPSRNYDFTLIAKFIPKVVGLGHYKMTDVDDIDKTFLIPEFITDHEVIIDREATLAFNKQKLNQNVLSDNGTMYYDKRHFYGEWRVFVDWPTVGKSSYFDEVKQYFSKMIGKDDIL